MEETVLASSPSTSSSLVSQYFLSGYAKDTVDVLAPALHWIFHAQLDSIQKKGLFSAFQIIIEKKNLRHRHLTFSLRYF